MLKDVSSNHADWIHDLRIVLIAAQKNYVLEAPLGARPAAGATPDVMNVWQSKADDYSIVQCAMLYGLEPGLQRRFERHGAQPGSQVGFGRVDLYQTHARIHYRVQRLPTTLPMGRWLHPCPNPPGHPTRLVTHRVSEKIVISLMIVGKGRQRRAPCSTTGVVFI